MKFLDLFGLKKSHFREGWAFLDNVSNNILSVSAIKGCVINMSHHPHVDIILDTIRENIELTIFGKISEDGEILIDGVSGIPMSSRCVEKCSELQQYCARSKVNHNGIFLEFSH